MLITDSGERCLFGLPSKQVSAIFSNALMDIAGEAGHGRKYLNLPFLPLLNRELPVCLICTAGLKDALFFTYRYIKLKKQNYLILQ